MKQADPKWFKIFTGDSLPQYLYGLQRQMEQTVQQEAQEYLLNIDKQKYSQYLYDKFSVQFPVLQLDNPTGSNETRPVPASALPRQLFDVREGQSYLKPI